MIVRYRPLLRGGFRLYQQRTIFDRQALNAFFVRFSSTDKSKVEETLRMLKEDIERQQADDNHKQLQPIGKPKLPIKTRIVNELKHYYHGFRLLALEIRLSAKYLWRIARGQPLTRRERQQLVRTVSDVFRLLPFSVFIIVPFMELALPLYLKFFPGMLPSTFQEASKEQEKIARQLKARIETAKFLQDTLEEIALERKKKAVTDSEEESKAHEFSQFLRKVRTEGGYVSNTDLFKFIKLFEDELTLDNLSMSQLRALCRLLGIPPLGMPEILRFQLNMKLRELKADDRLIAAEGGVDVLSAQELQSACRSRGMRALGVSEERLRSQLKQWLELSLDDKVPPSLLLLSRAMFFPEDISFAERIRSILSSLPNEIVEQTRQKLTELEGGRIDPKARVELVRSIEEALAQERKASKEAEERFEASAKAKAEPAIPASIDHAIDAAQEAVEQMQEVVANAAAKDAKLVPGSTSDEQTKAAKLREQKTAKKIDHDLLDSLEDILHGSPVQEAKYDITELKEKVIEHTEDLIEIGSLAGDYEESKIAKRLRGRVNSLISGVDALVAKLETEKKNIKEEVSDPAAPKAIEQTRKERLVKIKDLLNSLNQLQKVTDDVKSKRIEEVLHAMDVDVDGKVDANLILEVLELLGKHKDVEISAGQMKKIIEMLKKEDIIEALDRDHPPNTFSESQRSLSEKLEEVLPKLPAVEEFPVRSMASPTVAPPTTVPPPKEQRPPANP